MLHTIVPLEVIFNDDNVKIPEHHVMKVDGAELLVEPLGWGECKIVRVISSDPTHYLNDKFQPGSNLKLIL